MKELTEGDFKFADKASEENFRLACANEKNEWGFRPMVVIDGPPGSGKTSLARLIAAACGVSDLIELSPPQAKSRWPGVLTSLLEAKVVLFDNYVGRVNSPELARFITSPTWSYRPLYEFRIETKPCDVLVIITGNGVTLSEDLDRRARWIKLAEPIFDQPAR